MPDPESVQVGEGRSVKVPVIVPGIVNIITLTRSGVKYLLNFWVHEFRYTTSPTARLRHSCLYGKMAQVADKRVRGEVELVLSQEHFEQILKHARTEAPNEACGLLAGRDGYVTHVLPAANVAENPQVRYLMDPHEQIHHFHMIEEQGLDLLGIYHSHPVSQAYPSPTDLSMAYYPDAVYAIVSLTQSDNPNLRAFRMVDGQVSEVTFQMVPSEVTAGNAPALPRGSIEDLIQP